MRANAFVAVLICIAVFLAGCSADMNSTESDTDFKGAETTVQTNQNDTEQYTQDTEISDVINDTAFGDYGRLIFPVNSSYYSGDTLGELGLTWYTNIDPDKTVEIANYMKSHAENGDVIFYDIYTDEEKAADPAKEDTGLFFFKGNPGERFAVCNAGGGFAYVGAMHDSFPHALELSKMGYNAFALIYRPGAQTACEDLARAISFILKCRRIRSKHRLLFPLGRLGRRKNGGLARLLRHGCVRGKSFTAGRGCDYAVHRSQRIQRKRPADLRLCGRK